MARIPPSFDSLLELLYGSLFNAAHAAALDKVLACAVNPDPTAVQIDTGLVATPIDPERDNLLPAPLLPHLRNFALLQQRLQDAQQFALGLGNLPLAAWIVNHDGEVLHANARAHRIVEERHRCMHLYSQRLQASWKPDRPKLLQAIRGAAHDPGNRRARLLLHDSAGRASASCALHPLKHHGFDGWMLANKSAALLLLTPLAPGVAIPVDLLRQAYGLTQAEARLAQALALHGSLAACQGVLGKSHETLRTQLKAVFAKTGTRRQSELLLKLQELSS